MGICVGMAAAACSLTQTKRDGGIGPDITISGAPKRAGRLSQRQRCLSFTLVVWGLDVTNLNYSLVRCSDLTNIIHSGKEERNPEIVPGLQIA